MGTDSYQQNSLRYSLMHEVSDIGTGMLVDSSCLSERIIGCLDARHYSCSHVIHQVIHDDGGNGYESIRCT